MILPTVYPKVPQKHPAEALLTVSKHPIHDPFMKYCIDYSHIVGHCLKSCLDHDIIFWS